MGILVITVDLDCSRCRAKITKVLDCLKEEFCIEKVEFDDKKEKKVVVVRGKFDAEKLCKKVWSKAGKIVKGIVIAEVWPMPAAPKECKPEPHKCCDCEKCKPKPKPEPPKPPKCCDCEHCKPKPADPKPEKCCACCHCKPKPDPKPPICCVCCHCKPKEPEKKEEKKKEEKTKPPAAKTEYKFVPYPYPLPNPAMCPSWPWQCPPQQQCQCCQKPPPPPQPPKSPPKPPPCTCSSHAACVCGKTPPVWPPMPPPVWPPPWGTCNVVTEESACSVM